MPNGNLKLPGINVGLDIPETVREFLTVLRNIDSKLDTLIEEQQEANRNSVMDRLARATRDRQAFDAARGDQLARVELQCSPACTSGHPVDADLDRRPLDTNGWCVPCSAAGMCDLSPHCGRVGGSVPGLDDEQLAELRRRLEGR